MKKKKNKVLKIILYTLAVLVVAALVIIPFLLESLQDAVEQKASILNGTVEAGDISQSVSGTGTLTDAEAIELTVPEGVELTEYLVSEGDVVSQGDLIARTDRTTVMQAIDSVQETLDYLSEELADAEEGSSTQTVYANTAGRVKVVYASAGDSVQSVMLEHGCLAVMSIDGYMAVQVETGLLYDGDTVTVTLSDGTQVTGEVDIVRGSTATILISDEYGSIGEDVTLTTASGTKIGEAQLYIHSEWRAVAYTGAVSSVKCTEGRKVSTGAVLFNLKDTITTAAYDSLVSQRREYEDMMQRLFTMYLDGGITAPCDGIVSGLDDSLITDVAYNGEGYTIELLSSNNPDGSIDPNGTYTNYFGIVSAINQSGSFNMLLGDSWSGNNYGALPGTPDLNTMNLQAVVSCPSERIYDCCAISDDQSGTQWTTNYINVSVGDVFLITYSGGSIKWMIRLGNDPSFDPLTDSRNQNTGTDPTENNDQTNTGSSGMSSFSFGYSYSYSTEEEFELFSTDETTVAEVIPPDEMTVIITVDELDILQLSTGMEAQVTIDALPGQSFTGTVTSIDTTASNSGGNTKFTAEITVERNGYMLSGMNTGVLIVTDESRDVPVIPVEALSEENGKTVVYRGYDEEEECLTDPVEVETGVSDGINVEILSGLETGDNFYYSYLDTLDIYSMFNR